MSYYLGRLGNLVALPDPEIGLATPIERIGGTHQLLSGARVRDTIGYAKTWQMSWTAISLAQFGTLAGFYYGAAGVGPYYLFDPEQHNLLALNVSTGTDALQTASGFTLVGASTIASSVGSNLNWNSLGGPFPANGTQTLLAGVPTGTPALTSLWYVAGYQPIVAGQACTFSSYLNIDNVGVTAGLQARIGFDWYDASTSYVGTILGSTVTNTARSVATGTAPTNAVKALLWMQSIVANTSGSTAFMYADGLQFEMGPSATPWMPGAGLPLVTVDSLTRSTPVSGLVDAQMTLIQVG